MFLRHLFVSITLVFLVLAIAFSASTTKTVIHQNPWFDATGGPDAYGYTWIDSDEPGGPVYEWMDITATGTQIAGMGDDNYQGPFNIGFDFTYYWYTVTQFYVGSNGYLKFPPPTNIASVFPATIPIADGENDFIAGYMMDLTFDTGGEAWYWSNYTDMLVVSFINVPCWNTGGSHTFQFVLDGSDNTITVNYGNNVGTTYNNDILIGIENVNGQVGLLHSAETYIPHSNYTVVYNRPDTTTYQAHDLAVFDVISEGSKAIFIEQGDIYSPSIWVKNVGNQPESNATVQANIKNASGTIVWSENYNIASISAAEILLIPYTTSWTATATGQYTVEAEVNLLGDLNPNNDNKAGEVEVVVLPGELKYDDGVSETGTAWNDDDGGFAMYFESPQAPVQITQVRYYITTSNAPQVFIAQILDNDGPEGAPGTILFEQSVNCPTANQWYNVTVPSIVSENGNFYVAWFQTASSSVYMGIDQTAPISRLTWEYTGGWAPYRDAEDSEAMIRATVSPTTASDVQVALTPYGTPIQIPAGGGTFEFNIQISNNGASTVNTDIWTMATLPGGGEYGPIINVNFNLPPGLSANRDRIQNVPANAPPGNYTYNAYVGDYPGTIWDQDSFPFVKLADDMGGEFVYGWNNFGEPFEGEMDAEIAPSSFIVHSAFPNPFNPTTSITYDLSEAAKVNITVYDLTGREIAVLVDSWMDGGVHNAVFNAENLASGIYFYCLKAGDFTTTKKLVLMK